MADKQLKPHGVPTPKGTSWLKEVRIDAARNTVEQLRRQAEAREFEEAKARGITPEEIISKGREDLNLPEAEEPAQPTLESAKEEGDEKEQESEEVKRLKAELKAERAARTRAENKAKTAENKTAEPAVTTPDETANDEEETK